MSTTRSRHAAVGRPSAAPRAVAALCALVAWIAPLVAAAAAPTASTVVYAFHEWASPSAQSIRTMALVGGPGSELAGGPGLRRSPSWSHDGQRIAYISSREQVGTATIVVMGSDGRALEAIPLGDIQDVYHADWSRDGQSIAFVAHEMDKDRGGRLILYSVRISTGVVTTLVTKGGAAHPSWSPDGEWIVFAGGGYAEVVDASGGQRRRLTVGDARHVPAWSPDGSTIAYIRGDHDIYLVNSDGDARETVGVFPGVRLGDLSWYPTGKALLFTSTVGGVRRISRVDVDGSNVEAIAETRDGRFGRPAVYIPTLGRARRWSAPLPWGVLKQATEGR
jgi:Tol biopolymer transport system component